MNRMKRLEVSVNANNGGVEIAMKRVNVSNVEALGFLDMAKRDILARMKSSSKFDFRVKG